MYQKWLARGRIKVIYRWLKLNLFKILPNISEDQFKLLHQELLDDATWNQNYIVCSICSCLIASFGLIINSTAVIIGAMLIAPLMLPLRGLAFASCEGDFRLFRKAFFSIIGATILALLLSYFLGVIITLPDPGSEILSRTEPNLIDLGIAVTAGGMSGFAKVRKGVSDTLAGTAIAVALMPPLCVVGLALSQGFYPYSWGAFLLYITNLLGITLACMLVFILAGYTEINHAFSWALFLTALLVLPLGTSFLKLIEQQKLEAEIIRKLINETITVGQEVENTRIKIIWTKTPHLVYIILETDKEISPKQVRLVQDYINRKMKREFDLAFYVIPVKQITTEELIVTPDQPNDELEQTPLPLPENLPPILNKLPK
jgi:uncharacterized hydrophobic protein (TIGR00271 family)